MQNNPQYPSTRSQKILRGLSFLSLSYLTFVMCSFIYAANTVSPVFQTDLGYVLFATALAVFLVYTAFAQLFRQTRLLVLITLMAVIFCNIGQIIFLKMIEARVDLMVKENNPEGYLSSEPMFPISVFLLLTAIWYVPLIFPLIANFRKFPATTRAPA